jgi:hypothetical protein
MIRTAYDTRTDERKWKAIPATQIGDVTASFERAVATPVAITVRPVSDITQFKCKPTREFILAAKAAFDPFRADQAVNLVLMQMTISI